MPRTHKKNKKKVVRKKQNSTFYQPDQFVPQNSSKKTTFKELVNKHKYAIAGVGGAALGLTALSTINNVQRNPTFTLNVRPGNAQQGGTQVSHAPSIMPNSLSYASRPTNVATSGRVRRPPPPFLLFGFVKPKLLKDIKFLKTVKF